MKMYHYKIVTQQGEKMTGYLVNHSYHEVYKTLRAQHVTILYLHRRLFCIERLRFQQEAFIYFLKGLSWALVSGQPLSLALKTVDARGFLAIMTRDLWYRVSKGHALSQALEDYRGFVPPIVITFLRHGESAGDLQLGIEHAQRYLERRLALKAQLRSVLRMPTLTLVASVVTGTILYQQVGRIILPMLLDKHIHLSLWTHTLVWLTQRHWGWIFFEMTGVAAGVLFLYYLFFPRSQYYVHRQLFRYSALYANTQYSHAFEIISGLLEAHVPFLQALSVTEATLRCTYLKSQFKALIAVIKEGDDVVHACSAWIRFPYHYLQILRYGQEHGRLPEAFRQLRDVYMRTLDRNLTRWIQRIPLLCLTVVGGMLLFFVQSIMVPLYESMEALAHG